MHYPTFDEKNMASVQFNRANKHWDRPLLVAKYRDGRATEDWQHYTWADQAEDHHHLITAWNVLGVKPQERVAILGKNRPRWIQAAVSLLSSNIVFVPIYPTLLAKDIAYVLKDSGARFIVVDSMEQAGKVLSVFDELPALQKIFVMDPLEGDPDERIGSFEELVDLGRDRVDMEAIFERVRAIQGDDLVAIIYTSGTTGRPKGVMLSNDNFLCQRVVLPYFNLTSEDIFLNHLPFCHAFGLVADMLGAAEVGATLVIAEGIAPQQIRSALTTIRPTVLMSVPRLFEKLFIEVQRVVSTRPSQIQKIFHNALAIGKQVFDLKNTDQSVPLSLAIKYSLAKRILMKVRKQAGMDRLRVAYAGGGPTSRELCYFFQSLGIDIYQGYGLTETSPIANVNVPGRNKMGTVGPPIERVEEMIADDGEILIRGANLMKGYYNNPEATTKAIDDQGWFHSGDIGRFDEDGYLIITDRKKELIVTSGGKNIAPLEIESAYNTERYIERVVVIGDKRKFLSALVCPNFELLDDWAKRKGLKWGTPAELIALPQVVELIEQRIEAVNQNFPRFSQIKKFALIDHEFSEETGELTPTQKVKRRVVAQQYSQVIDGLYPKD